MRKRYVTVRGAATTARTTPRYKEPLVHRIALRHGIRYHGRLYRSGEQKNTFSIPAVSFSVGWYGLPGTVALMLNEKRISDFKNVKMCYHNK